MDDILTPENFDLLIYAVIVIGLILAAGRLYQDFTRPLPEDEFDYLAEPQPTTPPKNQQKG